LTTFTRPTPHGNGTAESIGHFFANSLAICRALDRRNAIHGFKMICVERVRAAKEYPPVRSVLIADNNVDAADSLAVLLRMSGHEVTTAYTGPEALAAVQTFAPDAVVLDVVLPKIDGYEVARRLRAASATLLLVAVTGYGRDEDRRRAHEAGFDHHLIKPADPAHILNLLSTSLA
jgi:CheY-like chemotaxis protein